MAIKRSTEDFRVEERLSEAVQASISPQPGRWAVYRLAKRRLSTPEAIDELARLLNVPPTDIIYPALKDKYAATTQHVSVRCVGPAGPAPHAKGPAPSAPKPPRGPQSQAQLPSQVKGSHLQAVRLGWMDQPLTGEAIAANRFEILVCNLTASQCRVMDGAAQLLCPDQTPGVVRIVNYFGRQRFGAVRHGGEFPARALVAGEFELALRLIVATPAPQDSPTQRRFRQVLSENWGHWRAVLPKLPEDPMKPAVAVLAQKGTFRDAFAALPYFIQQINVEAYQSFLWNAVASELVIRFCPSERIWEADDPLGLMRFVAADSIGPRLTHVVLPLLAPATVLAEPWAAATKAVLGRQGLRQEDLHVPGLNRPFFGEAPRPLLVDATHLSMGAPEHEVQARKGSKRFQRRLRFELPRGAYATVVLAAMGL